MLYIATTTPKGVPVLKGEHPKELLVLNGPKYSPKYSVPDWLSAQAGPAGHFIIRRRKTTSLLRGGLESGPMWGSEGGGLERKWGRVCIASGQ